VPCLFGLRVYEFTRKVARYENWKNTKNPGKIWNIEKLNFWYKWVLTKRFVDIDIMILSINILRAQLPSPFGKIQICKNQFRCLIFQSRRTWWNSQYKFGNTSGDDHKSSRHQNINWNRYITEYFQFPDFDPQRSKTYYSLECFIYADRSGYT